MNRGYPIYFEEANQILLPVFKCGFKSSLKAYKGLGTILDTFESIQDYEDAEKVTMVRNPFDRIVSLWTCGNNRERLHERSKTFEQFVDNIEILLKSGFVDGHYNTLVQNLSIEGRFMPDKVFKLENVDELVAYLPKIQNPFPVANASRNKDSDYTSYYTSPSIIEKVTKLYAEDLEMFGYSYGSYLPFPLLAIKFFIAPSTACYI